MNAITTTERRISPLSPQNFSELIDFAERAARSSMVPKDYAGKPENILLAVQMGAELGLAPMQSLQCIAVVNGRPSVWGDAMPGLCRQSPVCDDIEEWTEGEGDAVTAFCRATRVGKKPVVAKFSVADAKKAGLWGKVGPWSQYPQRMLVWRARSWALRDAFPDVLRGLMATEEARDIPPDTFTGPTIEAEAPPPSRRDQINAEVPLKAAAAPMPRGATVRAPVEPATNGKRTDEQWRVWLDKLRAACEVLYRRDEVVELGNRASVGDAIAGGPEWVRAEISRILAENYARFGDVSEETDEVHIEGEEKIGAG